MSRTKNDTHWTLWMALAVVFVALSWQGYKLYQLENHSKKYSTTTDKALTVLMDRIELLEEDQADLLGQVISSEELRKDLERRHHQLIRAHIKYGNHGLAASKSFEKRAQTIKISERELLEKALESRFRTFKMRTDSIFKNLEKDLERTE